MLQLEKSRFFIHFCRDTGGAEIKRVPDRPVLRSLPGLLEPAPAHVLRPITTSAQTQTIAILREASSLIYMVVVEEMRQTASVIWQ